MTELVTLNQPTGKLQMTGLSPDVDKKVSTLSSFKASLEKAKKSNSEDDTEQKVNEILKMIDKGMAIIQAEMSDPKTPNALKNKLLSLSKELSTVKADMGKGVTPDNLKSLMKMIDAMKTTQKGNQPLNAVDSLNQLLDDLKKRLGTDAVSFFTTLIQSISITLGLDKIQDTLAANSSIQRKATKGLAALTSNDGKNGSKLSQGKEINDQKKIIKNAQTLLTKEIESGKNGGAKGEANTHSSKSEGVSVGQWVTGRPVHKLQQFVLHSDSKSTSPGTQVLDQIRAILTKGNIKPLPSGGLELTIKLHPANLGTVQVVLTQTEAGLAATLTAGSAATKDLLQSQLSQLTQSFASLGVNVQKVDVGQFSGMQQNPSQFNGQAFGGSGGGQSQEQERQNSRGTPDYYDVETESTFEDWLLEGGIM